MYSATHTWLASYPIARDLIFGIAFLFLAPVTWLVALIFIVCGIFGITLLSVINSIGEHYLAQIAHQLKRIADSLDKKKPE